MKWIFRGILCLLTIGGVLGTTIGQASEVAYKTFVQSAQGLSETQPAYQATALLTSPVFEQIEALLIVDQQLWVVDAAAKTVFQCTLDGQVISAIHLKEFQEPSDIAVDQEGNLYVADPAAERVFKLSPFGTLLKEYGRPTEPLFGVRGVYKPRKITLDVRGNLYIIGDGATNGIIQLNQSGAFVGYLGANSTDRSFLARLQDSLLPADFLADRLANVPPTLTNIDSDSRGIVYTVTNVRSTDNIQKLNIAGINMLPTTIAFPERPIAIKAGPLGNFYVLTNEGLINEYTSNGDLLFTMGASAANAQRLGIYQTPTALAIDDQNRLYIADAEAGIHLLVPSDFAKEVHAGLALFEDGRYLESKEHWEMVLAMNNQFSFGHQALGQAFLREQAYPHALTAFHQSDDRTGYSQAFWEIRQQWIEANFTSSVVVVFICIGSVKLWRRRKKWRWDKEKRPPLIRRLMNDTRRLLTMIRHPFDAFYEIKKGQASLSFAVCLLLYLTVSFVFYLYCTGYIFQPAWATQYPLFLMVLLFVGIILLLLGVHYLVATITEGEGRLHTVFIGSMYAFAPLLLGWFPLTVVSNFLTFNEAFIFNYTWTVLLGWSLLLLLLMVKELHRFTVFEVVKNGVLTLFSFFMLVIAGYIVVVLMNQMRHFIYDILQEVMTRV